jgi:hypothetical protein
MVMGIKQPGRAIHAEGARQSDTVKHRDEIPAHRPGKRVSVPKRDLGTSYKGVATRPLNDRYG